MTTEDRDKRQLEVEVRFYQEYVAMLENRVNTLIDNSSKQYSDLMELYRAQVKENRELRRKNKPLFRFIIGYLKGERENG